MVSHAPHSRIGPRVAILAALWAAPIAAQESSRAPDDEAAIYTTIVQWICQRDPERSAPILLSLLRQTEADHSWESGRAASAADSLSTATADSLVATTCLEGVDRGEPRSWPRYATIRLSPPRMVDGEVEVLWMGRHSSARPGGGISTWMKSGFYRVARDAAGWTVVSERLDWIT